MPRTKKVNKPVEPANPVEKQPEAPLIDRIRKLSSVSKVLDLFNIEHASTVATDKFKVIFTNCKFCADKQKRSVTYFTWLDEFECSNNKKCGVKIYPKNLLGLVKMATDGQGNNLAPEFIARVITAHLSEIERERFELQKQFEARSKQYGVYAINK